MLVLNFLLAMLPILWLMVALAGLKMPGFKACAAAAVIAAVLLAAFLMNTFGLERFYRKLRIL